MNPSETDIKVYLGNHGEIGQQVSIGKIKLSLKPRPIENCDKVDCVFFQPRPEIHHIFREPEKRPHALLSSIFSGIVLSPWLYLIKTWSKLGFNIKAFPSDPFNLLIHSIFLSSIGGMLAVYYRYFMGVTLFPTLGYLGGLSIISVIFGRLVLIQRAQKRKE